MLVAVPPLLVWPSVTLGSYSVPPLLVWPSVTVIRTDAFAAPPAHVVAVVDAPVNLSAS